MPQEKKFYSEDLITKIKVFLNEYQNTRGLTTVAVETLRSLVNEAQPVLTIPEAEMDIENMFRSRIVFPNDPTVNECVKIAKEYSDLRLAKAMVKKKIRIKEDRFTSLEEKLHEILVKYGVDNLITYKAIEEILSETNNYEIVKDQQKNHPIIFSDLEMEMSAIIQHSSSLDSNAAEKLSDVIMREIIMRQLFLADKKKGEGK